MDLNPHATEGHYSHMDKEEIAVVMREEVYVELEGVEYFLEEGDVVRIPPNVKHRFINKGNEATYILFVLTPSLI